jgi:hypothetical protein
MMPKKKRQLPEPPGGPFKRKRAFGEEADSPQTADRLTAAMMEGRVDEFVEEEFGDIPGAKELAMMMLGATGMSPASVSPPKTAKKKASKKPAAKPGKKTAKKSAEETAKPGEQNFDKADIDTLMKIAAENNVSFDWLMARAVKLYARDYRTTGRI